MMFRPPGVTRTHDHLSIVVVYETIYNQMLFQLSYWWILFLNLCYIREKNVSTCMNLIFRNVGLDPFLETIIRQFLLLSILINGIRTENR